MKRAKVLIKKIQNNNVVLYVKRRKSHWVGITILKSKIPFLAAVTM